MRAYRTPSPPMTRSPRYGAYPQPQRGFDPRDVARAVELECMAMRMPVPPLLPNPHELYYSPVRVARSMWQVPLLHSDLLSQLLCVAGGSDTERARCAVRKHRFERGSVAWLNHHQLIDRWLDNRWLCGARWPSTEASKRGTVLHQPLCCPQSPHLLHQGPPLNLP